MNWKELYKEKILSAEQAIRHIKDNDYVVFSQTAGVPDVISKT